MKSGTGLAADVLFGWTVVGLVVLQGSNGSLPATGLLAKPSFWCFSATTAVCGACCALLYDDVYRLPRLISEKLLST